ncbi:PREDICTED: uncharacterized protein LOC106105925 isoform X1 [Papilio polytes]|uniref:uncharacterized protein LOC106105925 isoform X1 n=1 Tax=Papilio polytes TaxID=76194 RepID=UPI000675E264|nr:PREDICTED: uncharacterized protein LOC106105925 isoform X1 [Papilio polytes]
MANRSWGNQSQDWDPMRDDFNNSTFDPQYPDDNAGGVQLDHTRIYITNLPWNLTDDGLRTIFSKYGTIKESFLSRDLNKRYALVKYETSGEAKLAMMKLNKTEPLKMFVNIAHKKRPFINDPRDRGSNHTSQMSRDETSSICSRGRNSRRMDDTQPSINSEGDMDDLIGEDELGLVNSSDPDLHLELVQLKMERIKLQEEKLECKRMMILNRAGKKSVPVSSKNRSVLADGRIVVRNNNDRPSEVTGDSESFGVGSGDANSKRCRVQSWVRTSSEDRSSASTCVHFEDQDKSVTSKTDNSKLTESLQFKTIDVRDMKDSSKTGYTNEKDSDSGTLYEFKFSDFTSDNDEHDETNRIIQLRNLDYLDVVDEKLKVVLVLNGYPKSKMRLKEMEKFQTALTGIIDMQLKAGLLKKVPSFHDYYLNRGAIVCVCRDPDTRDWIVRITIGLEERMNEKLILLGSKIKRICLGLLKIPQSSWPATALDVFKLLQYFNPTLKTDMWKIYAQKIVENVECTSFLIDRVSGEIIRGPTFKNVIDYSNMEFELTGYTEIYYENFMNDLRDDLSSVASRVKLLEELKSDEVMTGNDSSLKVGDEWKVTNEVTDIKKDLVNSVQKDILKKLKDVEYINDKNETIVLSVNTNDTVSNSEVEKTQIINVHDNDEIDSLADFTDKGDSISASNENLIDRNSTITIDSNRGIAYHRRTNYLHVDAELKVAIALEGYPQNKLEGTHIRRLKRLFKEYLNKDVKNKRFTNLIIPKFQDVFLSNGAVIYICDSLETKDYLIEILPKFINSTSLKLIFKDVNDLVRYTRVVMRLPKELAHLESKDIISKLVEKYSGLKPDCWKYYSDVAGKQKRQFGVDPESIDIIKSPEFNFTYENELISFRIIDRKRKDVSVNEMETKSNAADSLKTEGNWEKISKEMYCPIDTDILNSTLTRIRTNHYSDIIADDLKLYVGPWNYPETRIDESLFFTIKNAMNLLVLDSVKEEVNAFIPKIHDIYLFDGVIFIICKDFKSKQWIEDNINEVNGKLNMNLKSTEFRGAVGIVSMMVVKTDKDTDEVISILQEQNPRLRTKFWRKISIVRSKNKLDVVLQIDKLSAQVISDASFNKFVGTSPVLFKLGHLQSLIRPKTSLEYIEKKHKETSNKDAKKITIENIEKVNKIEGKLSKIDTDSYSLDKNESFCKLTLKVPSKILPDHKEDFNIILDLLEDKNPGLNTELWQINYDTNYPGKGKFTLLVDKQSASVIKGQSFDPTLGGETLKFVF